MADNLFVSSKDVSIPWNSWMAPASILRLFFSASPSAIIGGITYCIVYSVQCFLAFWRLSHILKKSLKRFIPSFANSNALASVILIMRNIWIVASPSHCHPRCISRIANAFRSMVAKSIGGSFATSAASTSATLHSLRRNYSFNSAGASAKPVNTTKLSFGVVKDKPFAKLLSNLTDVVVRFFIVCHEMHYTTQKESYLA